MSEEEIYSSLIKKLIKDLSISNELLPSRTDLKFIREYLIEKVRELMSRDFDRFLNNLYRIDVNESKVHEILYSKDKTSIPEKLADLIIERQLLRIKTQMMYKKGEL